MNPRSFFRSLLVTLCLSGIALGSYAQTPTFKINGLGQVTSPTWETMRDVEFKKSAGGDYLPTFGEKIKALSGKRVELQGYFIPIEEGRNHGHFLFSSMPASACFFCGVGGPETVAEVYARVPVPYTTAPIRLLGTLTLNGTNQEQLMYVLKDATVLTD